MISVIQCCSIAFLTACLASVWANNTPVTKTYLIGIEGGRNPYSFIDDQNQPSGLLVNAALQLCEAVETRCHFITGNFEQLSQELQNYQLDGLLIIDRVVIPDIDGIKLTDSLCELQPVFIQRQVDRSRQEQQDFDRTTIGVLEASIFHWYLLDEYSSFARIESYPFMESAIFDLSTGRIDAVFTDLAFYNHRILETPLGQGNQDSVMVASAITTSELLDTGMTLGFNLQEVDFFESVKEYRRSQPSTSACSDFSVQAVDQESARE